MRIGEHFCPGILHAVPAKDGMLIRIRVPGGLLSARQLKAVAQISTEFANGEIEVTSRANLQVRAISENNLPVVTEMLSVAGLLPSRQHDRIRNIVTSPFAGLAPEEFVDTRPLVRELDRRLICDPIFAELHPKFSFGMYGGQTFTREVDDVSLEAVRSTGEFELYINGAPTGVIVPTGQGVTCLLEAAKLCITLAQRAGVPIRSRTLIPIPGMMEKIVRELSRFGTTSSDSREKAASLQTPLGVFPAIHADQANVVPLVPLGRLRSTQAERISELIDDCDGDLRLAPWRGIVLGGIPRHFVATITSQLNSVGLSLDASDGFRGIAACAGASGCDASLADVREDAVLLAKRLAGRTVAPGWTVNISGCEKQCAMRRGATVELVAGSAGYSFRFKGDTSSPGYLLPQDAIDATIAAHENYIAGVLAS